MNALSNNVDDDDEEQAMDVSPPSSPIPRSNTLTPKVEEAVLDGHIPQPKDANQGEPLQVDADETEEDLVSAQVNTDEHETVDDHDASEIDKVQDSADPDDAEEEPVHHTRSTFFPHVPLPTSFQS